MLVLHKESFKLPRLEKEKFIQLMRMGVSYDRTKGTFNAADCNNVDALLATLGEILHDEVTFEATSAATSVVTCQICKKEFSCKECRYYELCETKNQASPCICGKCLEEDKAAQVTLS